MLIVGIDPGISTGMATYSGGKLVRLETIAPVDIYSSLEMARPALVVFEDSRLMSHTWTTIKSRPASLKMARNIGEIDAWCRLIDAVCEQIGIPAHGVSPKEKGAKLGAADFERITGWKGRTNQHERDAVAVSWKYRLGGF